MKDLVYDVILPVVCFCALVAFVAVMKGGQVVTFAGATAGSVLPLRVTRINSTSTTATNLVCIW